jgi:multicomponent Na+:H+ antiporter subunit G
VTGTPLVAVLLLAAGVVLAVAASVAAVLAPGVLDRVHFLTVITSMAAPLVAGALAIANGWGLTTGQIVLTVGLLAVTGPVLGAAIGGLARVTADVEATEGPER